mmetsp:Transcript_10186/g.41243  ORF Transcript_10186/g.41243 Transcript_10186/m.41243 type:complete len:667 (+) Transcript_10186:1054-3054(+)
MTTKVGDTWMRSGGAHASSSSKTCSTSSSSSSKPPPPPSRRSSSTLVTCCVKSGGTSSYERCCVQGSVSSERLRKSATTAARRASKDASRGFCKVATRASSSAISSPADDSSSDDTATSSSSSSSSGSPPEVGSSPGSSSLLRTAAKTVPVASTEARRKAQTAVVARRNLFGAGPRATGDPDDAEDDACEAASHEEEGCSASTEASGSAAVTTGVSPSMTGKSASGSRSVSANCGTTPSANFAEPFSTKTIGSRQASRACGASAMRSPRSNLSKTPKVRSLSIVSASMGPWTSTSTHTKAADASFVAATWPAIQTSSGSSVASPRGRHRAPTEPSDVRAALGARFARSSASLLSPEASDAVSAAAVVSSAGRGGGVSSGVVGAVLLGVTGSEPAWSASAGFGWSATPDKSGPSSAAPNMYFAAFDEAQNITVDSSDCQSPFAGPASMTQSPSLTAGTLYRGDCCCCCCWSAEVVALAERALSSSAAKPADRARRAPPEGHAPSFFFVVVAVPFVLLVLGVAPAAACRAGCFVLFDDGRRVRRRRPATVSASGRRFWIHADRDDGSRPDSGRAGRRQYLEADRTFARIAPTTTAAASAVNPPVAAVVDDDDERRGCAGTSSSSVASSSSSSSSSSSENRAGVQPPPGSSAAHGASDDRAATSLNSST